MVRPALRGGEIWGAVPRIASSPLARTSSGANFVPPLRGAFARLRSCFAVPGVVGRQWSNWHERDRASDPGLKIPVMGQRSSRGGEPLNLFQKCPAELENHPSGAEAPSILLRFRHE